MNRKKFMNEVSVFKETRYLSQTEFKEQTEKLIADTQFYRDANLLKAEQWVPVNNITFVAGGSVSVAYKYLEKGKRVAVLNFADAIIPGGLVEVGAPTQEENICRCTNLYESLVNSNEYYYQNARVKTSTYTNGLIYSPDVVVFRDDITYDRITPKAFDVITCPAPSMKVNKKILVERIEGIIKSAIQNGVEIIVLGAWGCGAFGQDPKVIGMCFAKALNKYNAFDEVVFAIRPTFNSEYIGYDASNREMFEQSFRKHYNGKKKK